jgi:endogenous inhibitor of DNA gyrase (YacG/DUF329 family)
MKCEECGHPVKNFKALATHIQFKHDKKNYYDRYMKKEGEGVCKICSKPTEFTILGRGYEKFCSKECQKIDMSENMKRLDYIAIHEKKKKTNLEKYGVEHNLQRHDIKEQIKQTCLNKYGVENVIQFKEIKECAKKHREETCVKEHGVKNYFSVKEVQDKVKETHLAKYGVEFIGQSEEIKSKTKKTNLKRYGVEYIMQNPEIFEKAQKHSGGAKHFKDLYYRGSYELDFLEKYYDKFEIKQGLSFKYKLNEENKVYHSDFYIPTLNLVVEIKNSYLAKKDESVINKKKRSVIVSGYNYIMIINKDYSEFNNLISTLHE